MFEYSKKETKTYFLSAGAILFTMNVQSNNTDQELTLQSPTNHFVIDNLLPGGWYDVAVTSFGVNNRRNPTPSKTLSFQTGKML